MNTLKKNSALFSRSPEELSKEKIKMVETKIRAIEKKKQLLIQKESKLAEKKKKLEDRRQEFVLEGRGLTLKAMLEREAQKKQTLVSE